MDLSIIVVNWNTRGLLAECLQSVYDTVEGLAFEVLVVDNASTDGSAAMVRERFPHVRLIENGDNVGFSRANNQAIRESAGRYVLLLNSDARLVGDAARQMLGLMDRRDDAGIGGAHLVSPGGHRQLAYGPLPTLASEVFSLFGLDKRGPATIRRGNPGRPFVETGWVTGACLMARRRTLDEVGLLDETYFMFSEEIDLCHRVGAAGWKTIHLPTALAIHVGGASTGPTPERMLRIYRGKLQYFAKHHSALARRALLGAIWLSAVTKALAYTLLGALSLGRVRKGALWRGVVKGLARGRA